MNAMIIICSRKESSRLSGKAVKAIAGRPAILHILARLQGCGLRTVVAVPRGQGGDYSGLIRRANYTPEQIEVFEGDPDSPLHRTAEVLMAENPRPRYYIRITHDDILIDQQTMLDLLAEVEKQGAGYGFSPGIVEGAGVEVIETQTLLEAAKAHPEPVEFISWYTRGAVYNPKIVRFEPRESVRRGYRLTMDYPEDALVLEAVLRAVGPDASLDRVVEFLDNNPSLLGINRQPLVSVYTAVRNGARWIGGALWSSLRGQDLGHGMEHIVVDDCSEDTTLAEVAKFSSDSRLKILLNDKRLYVSGSSNRAVAAARGRYVIRLDADDKFMLEAINRMVSVLKREDAMAVYSGYHEIDENGARTAVNQKPNLELAGGALMRRDWLYHFRFNDKLTHHDGIEFASRMAGQFKIAKINDPLWCYRVHAGSHSRSKENKAERERIARDIGVGA